jgi:ferrous iron transport protein B
MINCALIGLPNTGKTSFFNALTNSRGKTGNWSGVTVQESHAKIQGTEITVIDLPGVIGLFESHDQIDYQVSLTAVETADIIVQVLDVQHLHRDLILTIQLLLLGKPLVVVLNHTKEQNLKMIQKMLPVIALPFDAPTSCFIDAIKSSKVVNFDSVVDWPVGFSSVYQKAPIQGTKKDKMQWLIQSSFEIDGLSMDVLIHETFYNTARTWLNRAGLLKKNAMRHLYLDEYLLSPWIGVPIFLVMMYLMFFCTIGIGGVIGEFLSDLMQVLFNFILPDNFLGRAVYSVATGVAMCAAFIPILSIMYIFIGYMEQTGYLARVALLADILMRPLGLSGHSFIPLLLGFGCNVPAIMAIRVVEGRSQRLLTALMVPFISCSARLSILAIFAGAFFAKIATTVILTLYVCGLMLAFFSLWWLKKVLNIGKAASMSLSLPQIQWPEFSSIVHNAHLRVKTFVLRSAKLIVGFSGAVGLLSNINQYGEVVDIEYSLIAVLGKTIAPYFSFMGLGIELWQPVVALLAGVVAKEIVLTTLNSLYHLSAVSELGFVDSIMDVCAQMYHRLLELFGVEVLGEAASPLQQVIPSEAALAYMVFILLYFPCVSTLVVLKQECGTKWALLSFGFTTVLSVWAATVVYRGVGLETVILAIIMLLCIILRNIYDAYCSAKTIYAS